MSLFAPFAAKNAFEQIKLTPKYYSTSILNNSVDVNDESNIPVVLHQFAPAWDVQAYARMAKIRLHVQNGKYISHEATGDLPQLSDGNYLVESDRIIGHLKSYYSNIDKDLSEEEMSEIYSSSALVMGDLKQVLRYSQFMDDTNYQQIVRPAICKRLPMPIKLYLPKQYRTKVCTDLHVLKLTDKDRVFEVAKNAYTALNAKCSKGRYFFGSKPTSLDAIVFGHVVAAMDDLLLKDLVQVYAPNLIKHAELIRDTYFSNNTVLYTCNNEDPVRYCPLGFMDKNKATVNIDNSWISKPYEACSLKFRDMEIKRMSLNRVSSPQEQKKMEEDARLDAESRYAIGFSVISMLLYGLSFVRVHTEYE